MTLEPTWGARVCLRDALAKEPLFLQKQQLCCVEGQGQPPATGCPQPHLWKVAFRPLPRSDGACLYPGSGKGGGSYLRGNEGEVCTPGAFALAESWALLIAVM